MVLNFFRANDGERLDRIEEKIQQMLLHDRRQYELAMSALLGEVVAADVNRELRASDRKVNELEREIRRELLVHASVFGGINTPAVLIYMSIVKDIERIGDYAKNLLDLALDGVDLRNGPNVDHWVTLKAEILTQIDDTAIAFRLRDEEMSRQILTRCGRRLREFDAEVSILVRSEGTEPVAVGRALAHRYLKRIVAHLMNVLTAVVMPADKLDFFDEDPEDRT